MGDYEKITGEQREMFWARAGELANWLLVLRDAEVEVRAIQVEWLRAIEQPRVVAGDTVAPLPDRIVAVMNKLREVVR